MDIIEAVRDELVNRKTALADRFSHVYTASVGFHLWNQVNQVKQIYYEQGRLRNSRLHIIMVAPPGFMKSYLIEQFLDGSHAIMHETGIDLSFMDIVTEAGLIGTIKHGAEGNVMIEQGAAHRHMYGIIGCDEFSGITAMMKQGHSATLDPALLKLLDSGSIEKSLAAGELKYTTHFTFWASTQPMRFELYGGLFRRFLPIEFVPTEYEKDLIRQHRRMGRNRRPSDSNLRNLRAAIKQLPEKMGRIKDVVFDPAMDAYFDKKKSIVPHFEEIVYERFAVGYTIMKGNFNETLQLVFDKELEGYMDKLIDWRLQLKRGSASSQVMRILNQNHGTMKELDLKQELLDFGMTWSDSTMLLSEMVRDRFISRSGDIIRGIVT